VSDLLIVSNRLPVRIVTDGDATRMERSAGGLATGLGSALERRSATWIGWPGDLSQTDAATRRSIEAQLAELHLVPVHLSVDLVRRYYDGFSNRVLWPLFHYLTYALPFDMSDFDAYEAANERFAETVASRWRPGDVVWVHDYHLLLVPELLRRRCPEARIGFFLHIPFPSSELFRSLPGRERLLRGMLGADLIGFHTAAYLRHFASTATRILGAATEIEWVRWGGRDVRLGVFPMGIDAAGFAATAAEPAVAREAAELRADGQVRILLGVDRLDYTKGIPRRLLAFERLLELHPELREKVRLVQVAVPSREDVDAYQATRSRADELIGRIHGVFATPRWVPVHWMYRSFSREQVVALYRAADVMLVTPIRDGMNLVAKEFVASRTDGDGVLVLSELAGASAELAEALHVNPFDVEATAESFHRALTLPESERRRRMAALRRRVLQYDVHRWVEDFLGTLGAIRRERPPLVPSPPGVMQALAEELRTSPRLVLLVDYDGTLVPLHRTPDLASPDDEAMELLRALAAQPRLDVHVVSGRTREVLDEWLGALAIGLHGEHGLWSRPSGGAWTCDAPDVRSWYDGVLSVLDGYAARTPGSLVERKTASLAWHWRASDPEFGAFQAKDLQLHLSELLSNQPVEVMLGDYVIEVRPHGMNKGRIVTRLLASAPPGSRLVALGDDRTDEDTFAALPEGGVAIHVGPLPSRAPYRLAGVAEARAWLRELLAAGA
jgi:trehalose 6-phosphate synthase/phosphatase